MKNEIILAQTLKLQKKKQENIYIRQKDFAEKNKNLNFEFRKKLPEISSKKERLKIEINQDEIYELSNDVLSPANETPFHINSRQSATNKNSDIAQELSWVNFNFRDLPLSRKNNSNL